MSSDLTASDSAANGVESASHMLKEHVGFLSPPLIEENMDRYLLRSSILNAIKAFLAQSKGTLLDVGCGEMPYKPLVLEYGVRYNYVGLDIKNPRYQQEVKPDLFWDGTKIPLGDSSVDCAMATELFEHLPEPEKVMKEICRVLKPGGQLFFTVPFLWPLHDLPNDEYRYTPFALERHLDNSGFNNIILKPLGGWDACLAQMIGLWVRRKPMPEAERIKISNELFPFYCKLIESDEIPEKFSEGQMITGLYGTAAKSRFDHGKTGRENYFNNSEIADMALLKSCYLLLHIPVPSETFVINEILALQSVGVDVHTVALWPPQECHKELMSRMKNPVYHLFGEAVLQNVTKNRFYSTACTLAASYKIMPELAVKAALAAEYVVNHEIKHIHSHFASEAALVAMLVSKLTGIPYSFTAHAYDIFRLNVAGERDPERRLKMLVEHAARLITVSEYNRRHFLELTGNSCADKLEIIHYGMDLARFNRFERTSNVTVTFLSVGRLVEKKGHEYLLRAFKNLLETCNARLRLIGDGPLFSSVTALVQELGIADKVTFIGAVSSDVVLHEMKNADVFVLHSVTGQDGDREGMPVSIMEACVTGLPVVSTRHAGIPELIHEGISGFLVDEKDWQGFAEAMSTLALSRELRIKMGQAGHEIVAKNFNILHEAQKLKEIFSAVVEEASTKQHVQIINSDVPAFNFHFLKREAINAIKQLLRRK